MPFQEFLSGLDQSTLVMRILTSLLAFVILAGASAVGTTFALMMVLFSADNSHTDNGTFDRASIVYLIGIAIAVLLPPIMIMFRANIAQAAIAATCGFAVAALSVVWVIGTYLGGN